MQASAPVTFDFRKALAREAGMAFVLIAIASFVPGFVGFRAVMVLLALVLVVTALFRSAYALHLDEEELCATRHSVFGRQQRRIPLKDIQKTTLATPSGSTLIGSGNGWGALFPASFHRLTVTTTDGKTHTFHHQGDPEILKQFRGDLAAAAAAASGGRSTLIQS